MLSEFIQTITSLARQSAETKVLKVEGSHRKLIVSQNGTHEWVDIDPPLRKCSLIGFDDVVATVTDSGMCPKPEVWVGPRGVVVLPDRDDRHERLTLEPAMSERFELLVGLSGKRGGMSQRDALRMLRLQLNGTGVGAVETALRRLTFQRRSDGGGSIEHGRESLGRSVEAEVQQADSIPTEFTVTTPVWVNPGMRSLTSVPVQVGVFLDLEAETVELRPLADEVAGGLLRAQQLVASGLREALDDAGHPACPVLLGAP